MSKFKVGDTVIGNEKASGRYSITGKGWKGTVTEITGVNHFEAVHFDDEYFDLEDEYFDLFKSSCTSKILITSDGTTTLARLYDGDKVIKKAEAKCAPGDTYDFAVGADLAYQRLMHPEVKQAPANKYEGMSDDELSNAICSYRRCYNWGGTCKNCTSRPYCHDGKGSYAYILEHRAEAIAYLLAEDEAKAKQDKPAEPTKEPVKLYCINDYAPGEWTTKGKIYEKQADGRIRFDGGHCIDPMPFGSAAKSLVPLVKRPAKVGEWVLVSNGAIGTAVDYRGKVVKITSIHGIPYFTPDGDTIRQAPLTHGEYLVLDGYTAPVGPEQPKPQYYNGKAVCIESKNSFITKGWAYTFENGLSKDDDGDVLPCGETRIKSIDELNGILLSQFIEFKGERSK